MLPSKLVNIYKNFTTQSTNRKIFSAAVTVGLMTVLVNCASISKQLIIAWKFGRGDDIDAFLIALLVPSLLVNVVGGSFNAAFIPTYIQVKRQEGTAAAQKLFSGVTAWSSLLLLITTVVCVITAPYYLPFLGSGFTPEKLNLTFRLLCIISPMVILSGTITIWSAVLNAGERFAFAALTPSITPLITVLLLFIPFLQIYAIALGLVAGLFLETVALGIALKKQGISVIPKFYSFDSNLRQVAAQYIPMIAGAFLMSCTSLVDQSMAAMLSPGSVAALDYGNRLIALPLGLATKSLSTAVIPYFSQMVAEKDWSAITYTLRKYLLLTLIISILLTLCLFLFSDEITQLVFERGAFTSDDTYVVAKIQSYYVWQIPFYMGGILLVRLISAMKLNHILMWGSFINLFLNIILNFAFLKFIGIYGIALSTTCVYIFSFFFVLYFCHKELKPRLISHSGLTHGHHM